MFATSRNGKNSFLNKCEKKTMKKTVYRRVPDIRSIIVNLARYHTTNWLAAHANENGPVTGGCPVSSMVTVNIHGQHLYRELNY